MTLSQHNLQYRSHGDDLQNNEVGKHWHFIIVLLGAWTNCKMNMSHLTTVLLSQIGTKTLPEPVFCPLVVRSKEGRKTEQNKTNKQKKAAVWLIKSGCSPGQMTEMWIIHALIECWNPCVFMPTWVSTLHKWHINNTATSSHCKPLVDNRQTGPLA